MLNLILSASGGYAIFLPLIIQAHKFRVSFTNCVIGHGHVLNVHGLHDKQAQNTAKYMCGGTLAERVCVATPYSTCLRSFNQWNFLPEGSVWQCDGLHRRSFPTRKRNTNNALVGKHKQLG